jgi:hypothetical protein
MLEPYVISTNVQFQNPEEFNYTYNGYGSFENMIQKFQASGENHIIYNIPLGSIVSILTMTQVNEIKKKHYLYLMSCKPLAEKRAAVKFHICTKSCNERVTLFKAVEKNQKVQQHQSKARVEKVVSQPKVGKNPTQSLIRRLLQITNTISKTMFSFLLLHHQTVLCIK